MNHQQVFSHVADITEKLQELGLVIDHVKIKMNNTAALVDMTIVINPASNNVSLADVDEGKMPDVLTKTRGMILERRDVFACSKWLYEDKWSDEMELVAMLDSMKFLPSRH